MGYNQLSIMKNVHLAVLCASIIIMVSVSGCIWEEEKEKKGEEIYVLEAVISVDKNIVYPNEIITFDASSSKGDIEKYYWNFTGGNNWEDEGTEVTHEYSEPGYYIVKLKVVDVNEDHDYDTVDVYVNYKAEYEGNITKGNNESYFFPNNPASKKAFITLKYEPYNGIAGIGLNQNNLDLYVYYNATDDSEVKNSSTLLDPTAKSTIEETLTITKNEGLIRPGEWRANVKCESSSAVPVDYHLTIEVYYNY